MKTEIHYVDLGYNISEEINRTIKSEIDSKTVEEISDMLEAISDRPGNKKAAQKIEDETNMTKCVEYCQEHGSIDADTITKFTGLNLISAVGKLRNFSVVHANKRFVKARKGIYELQDV